MRGFARRRSSGSPGGRRRAAMLVAGTATVCLAVAAVGAGGAAQATTAAPEYAHAWLNPKLDPGQRASALLAQMTEADKFQMVDGTGFAFGSGVNYAGHIQGIPALGIPDLYLADGAVGAGNGSTGVTQFPDGTSDAATWDPGTVQSVGAADGTEQAAKGHQVSLAPNLNILRTPYGGRAFEGYGEDPYLVVADRRRGHHRRAERRRDRDRQALHRQRPGDAAQLDRRAGLPAGAGRDLRPGVPGGGERRRGRRDVLLQPGQRLLRVPELADAVGHARLGDELQGLRDERLGRDALHRRVGRRRARHEHAGRRRSAPTTTARPRCRRP